MEEITVPFAFCEECQSKNPVAIKEFDFDEDSEEPIEIIFCPMCESIINIDSEVNVEYFSIEEVKNLGYNIKIENDPDK